MQEQERRRVGRSGWRGALAVVTICVLTLSFATRFGAVPDVFWAAGSSHSQAGKFVDHRLAEPERQHLDRDGTEWAPPNITVSLVHFTPSEAPPVSAGTLLPTRRFSGRLHVRPPPSA